MQEVVGENAGVAKEEIIATNVRLPVEMHRELSELAAEERRSLNGQILVALESYLRNRKPAKAKR